MAKKTTRPKSKTAHRNVTSVGELRASRAVDAITPAFVDWCREAENVPAEDALVLLGPVRRLVAAYFHASPAAAATNFEPVPFWLAMEAVLSEPDDEEDWAGFAFHAVHVYLEFLSATDAWTGTDEDFEAVDDLFHMKEERVLPQVTLPILTEQEELAGLEGTVLAQRMEALLTWIGSGKDVTSTGALRLKDIEGAAAAVGVAARGAKANAKREQLPFFSLEHAPPGHVRTVKSMRELPLLDKFWVALDASGLVDIGSTKVWPTPLAEEFLVPGHPGRLAVLRDFTTKFLAVAIVGEAEWAPWVTQAAMAQASVLFAACANAPVPAKALSDPENLEALDVDEFGARLLQERMAELAELGLVTMEGIIAVPPAVAPSILAVVHAGFPDDDSWPAEQAPEPKIAKRKRRKSGAPARLLQLKVMLKGSKPPIWRRLVLRSDLTLDQLHQVLQLSFGWMDSHLHEFQVGGYGGTAYGPVGPEFDFGDPMPIDESAVEIGELLSAEKDAITYVYDFGDDWQHTVTLEKVLPYDGGVPAVRCTGGRGAGPAEDSGGVWGWESMVEAVNDPSHEEHDEYRDWLGLAAGELLDPKAFDPGEVNVRLLASF